MATTSYTADPYNYAKFVAKRDEDLTDAFPPIRESGTAKDCTGLTLELYVRPDFGHPLLIKKFSTATGDLTWTDDSAGEAAFSFARADVIEELDAGEWKMFSVLSDPAGSPDTAREFFRGDFIVLDGNISE